MPIDYKDVYGIPEDQIIPLPESKSYYEKMLDLLDSPPKKPAPPEPEAPQDGREHWVKPGNFYDDIRR